MGIRGLTKALRLFTSKKILSGKTVVIDGPSLVYRVWESLVKPQTLDIVLLGQVPYSSIGQATIGWLDGLRAKNVDVRKIYFDGFLPPRKMETRRERLIKQTEGIFAAAQRRDWLPMSKEIVINDLNATLDKNNTRYPPPPFLIPAAIDSLRNSPHWKSVLQVVPGEADVFCAQDVRRNGGIVLSADSDLIIDDLGPEGEVVFFGDIIDKPGEDTIDAWHYDPRAMEDKLEVTDKGGLTRVAYEFEGRGCSIKEAVHLAQSTNEADSKYQDFISEHLAEEYISADHPVLPVLFNLDPRISELVIQSLNIEVMKKPEEVVRKGAPRGPEELSMFLPVMVEDPAKKSSWSMSEAVRQLAYSLAQPPESERRRDSMIEYRTLLTASGGRKVEILSLEDVDNWCESLLATIEQINEGLKDQALRWIAFAIYQDIAWSNSESRTPISTQLISDAIHLEGRPNEYSFNALHFTAQVQASLYSFRLLKQILDVMAYLSSSGLPKSQENLRQYLSNVPEITEYPTAEGIFDAICQFAKAHGLSVICNVLAIDEIVVADKPPAAPFGFSTHKRRQNVPQKKGLSPSANPIARVSLHAALASKSSAHK